MRRRRRTAKVDENVPVAERLRPFVDASPAAEEAARPRDESAPELLDDLMERAVTLLSFMPRNQKRQTIETLISPYDKARGRDAIDALVAADFVAEDELGRLRRLR